MARTNTCDQVAEVVMDDRADHLPLYVANMPDSHPTTLNVIELLGPRTIYLERALDTGLSFKARRKVDNGAQRANEMVMELPRAEEAQPFFQEGCPRVRS